MSFDEAKMKADVKAAVAGLDAPDTGVDIPEGDNFNDVEQEAIQRGWSPDGVEGKRNLSAEEFLDRQPLYDDIRSLKKQTRKLQEGIDAMKQMHDGIRKNEREKTIRELKEKKAYALENEQYDEVVELDEQIADAKAVEDTPASNEAFAEWVEANDWYNDDVTMREYADMIGYGYAQKNPNAPIEKVYAYVAKETLTRYPLEGDDAEEEEEAPRRRRRSSVEGAARGRSRAGTSRHSSRDLSDEERRIMRTVMRSTKMTEQEYLKSYYGE